MPRSRRARRRSASENPRRPVAAPGHDPEKLTDFSDKITRKNKRLERDDESTKVIPLEARAAAMTPTAGFWETKIASELPILRWRTSPRRVRRRAVELIENHGEVAFFRAHEFAWAAQGQAKHYEAKFWQAVSREIGRQIQRQRIIAFISSAAS
jgi:hypothetical protein